MILKVKKQCSQNGSQLTKNMPMQKHSHTVTFHLDGNGMNQSYKEACAARGLLNDDNEWYKTFEEATNWATASQLRNLFTTMLTFCDLKDEREFFEKNWAKMVDDIEKQLILKYYPINYTPSEIELQDLLLDELEDIFSKNGQQINNYNLPRRSSHHILDPSNRLIQEEMNYDIKHLEEEEANKLYLQLNKEQKEAFHQIIDSVINSKSRFYFVWSWRNRQDIFCGIVLFLI